jgi:alanine racemase
VTGPGFPTGPDLPSGPVATVDLRAYRRNIDRIRTRVAPANLMAVVKADAYGHGLLPIARTAVSAGVGWIGALDLATALELRAGGIHADVAIFAWLLGPNDDFAPPIEAGIDLGVSTVEQLEAIAASGASGIARVHLKIDTGLHRNGADAADWPALVGRALELEDRVDLVGVWTHISEASDAEDTVAIERFHEAIAVAQRLGAGFGVRHLAASAASFARADARFDVVRVGAFGYGISPGGGITPESLRLEPVLTLTAPVYAVRDGIARVAIGFGDGILGSAAGLMEVAINGTRHPIVDVEIDTLRVAIGTTTVSQGDTAVLFGSGSLGEPTLQEWGDRLGTIGEEIVTRLSPRIPRRHIHPGV